MGRIVALNVAITAVGVRVASLPADRHCNARSAVDEHQRRLGRAGPNGVPSRECDVDPNYWGQRRTHRGALHVQGNNCPQRLTDDGPGPTRFLPATVDVRPGAARRRKGRAYGRKRLDDRPIEWPTRGAVKDNERLTALEVKSWLAGCP